MIQTYAKAKYKYMDGPTAEKYLYKEIFNKYYPDREVIPYMWMPKFVSATDASARTLDVYKSIKSAHANPEL